MQAEIEKNSFAENNNYFWRAMLIIAPLFVFILLFNKTSLFLILAIVFTFFIYFVLKDDIWILLIFALPSLMLGQVVYIPVTVNWVYEAGIAEIFLFLTAIVFLLDKFLSGKIKEIKLDQIGFWLFIYLVLSLASFWQVIDNRLFVVGMKTIVFSFLSYFLTLNLLNSRAKIRAFLYGMGIAAVILSAQLFIKFYQMGFSSKFFFERSTILIPLGPIATAAAILAFLSVLIFGFYFAENKQASKFSPFIFMAFLFSSAAVFLTLGKGAIAALIAGLLLIFYRIKSSRLPLIMLMLWFMVIGYFFLNPFLAGLWERLNIMFVDVNTKFRVLEYHTSWQLIKDHIYLGVGAGQQLAYFKKLLNLDNGQLVNNFFLQSMLDLGLTGFSVLIILILNIIFKIEKIGRAQKNNYLLIGLIAALVCAFLNGLVEVTFFALPYAIVFWLIMGVVINSRNYEKTIGNYN